MVLAVWPHSQAPSSFAVLAAQVLAKQQRQSQKNRRVRHSWFMQSDIGGSYSRAHTDCDLLPATPWQSVVFKARQRVACGRQTCREQVVLSIRHAVHYPGLARKCEGTYDRAALRDAFREKAHQNDSIELLGHVDDSAKFDAFLDAVGERPLPA